MSRPSFDPAGCGCCRQVESFPAEIWNRPSLSAIAYRIGDYNVFRENLLVRIPGKQLLRELHARDTTDYGIAVLDLWAYLADILTFYQERIANEAFLRTATLRDSVLRLAALIDYRLGPGAAAATHLAFTLDRNKSLVLPVGLRVQSVPGQNEKPQKFETVEELSADARFNLLSAWPLPAAFNPYATGNTRAALALETAAALTKALVRSEKLLIVSPVSLERKQLLTARKDEREFVLEWDVPVQTSGLKAPDAQALTYNRVFAAFGASAPQTYMSVAEAAAEPGGFKWTLNQRNDAAYDLSINAIPPALPEVPLGQKVDDLKAGTQVLLAARNAAGETLTRLTTVVQAEARSASFPPLTEQVTYLKLGIAAQGTPVGIGGPSDRVFVFAIGDDGAVWMRATGASSGFKDWQSLGGQAAVIAVQRDGNSRWRLFAAGRDGAVRTIRQRGADSWGTWESLGGQATALASALHPDGLITLVARGSDGSIRALQELQPGVWGAWQHLGGLMSHIAAGFGPDASFYAFGIGENHAVWYNRRLSTGAWQGWVSLGGWVDLLTVQRNQDGRLAVFARGRDQGLWLNNQNNAGWSGWVAMGGGIDQLAATTTQGRIVVLARGSDKALWIKSQTAANASTYSGWSASAGPSFPLDGLSAGNLVSGSYCFAVTATPEGSTSIMVVPSSRPIALGYPVWSTADRRTLAVYEITRPALALREQTFAASITGNQVSVPLSALPSIEIGRRLILDDSLQQPHFAEVLSVTAAGESLLITFTPTLTRALQTGSAVLCGNVVKATHGETVRNEVLGSGDASQRFLTFTLKKSPVTYVPQPGQPNGVANTLAVRVDGILWKEVPNLLDASASERVFTTRLDNDAKMTVQFGGSPGARVPTGKNNVVATYRQGLGEAGNVRPRSLTTLLDRPAGLKAVFNPAAAEGGSPQETLEQARTNAPSTVQTFGRIVSVRDFEDAARELSIVAKARAYVDWDGEEEAVFVVVAGAGGSSLVNSVRDIAASLDALRDTNRKMNIVPHTPLPVQAAIDVIADPAYTLEAVQGSVEAALKDLFLFDNRGLGQPVFLSDFYRVLQAQPGVVAVDVDVLRPRDVAGVPPMADVFVPPGAIATLDLADAAIGVSHGDF